MSSIGAVEQSLNSIGKLYGDILADSRVYKKDREISWYYYSAGIAKRVCYPREYQLLIDAQQFSFLLTDGSFFQFYYSFYDGGDLKKARLAFYPAPMLIEEKQDEIETYIDTASEALSEVYFSMLEDIDSGSGFYPGKNSHLRVDYDHEVVSHSKLHLQFGALNEFRLSAKSICLPFGFFTMILRSLYSDWYVSLSARSGFRDAVRHSYNRKTCVDEHEDIYLDVGDEVRLGR
ncbi:DUF2290 domain-containing protein [Billgrantia saliphila]|uniref:DUF2290 domain-containing protein n=1 Tax=Billgrantia saliphila TaxID=1848458 RepID=UPI000CE54AD1|nr:DUF2290 domain-containing protein [Halomonas saliphila]